MQARSNIIGLLFVGSVVSYLDRAALAVAAPLMVADLGLSPGSLGIVFSAFFIGYAISCFIGGLAADRIGPTRVILWTMLAWSIFCGLTGVATTLMTLLAIRLLFGMSEGPYQSNLTKLIGNWFPSERRGTAISLAISGTTLGGALAGPIVGFLALHYGWRVSFIAVAAIGVLWSIGWALVASDKPRDPVLIAALAAQERPAVLAPVGGTEMAKVLSYMISPAILATAVAFFGFAYLLYFFLSWFPTYLTMERHLSVANMSYVSAIPWFMGFIGYVAGGLISDAFARRTGQVVLARKLVLVSCLIVAAICVALAGYANSAAMAAALMGCSVLFLYMSANSYFAIILDTVAQSYVGTVGGFIHMLANLAGVLAPVITGYIVEATGSFTGAFVLAGGIALAGALSVAAFVHPEKRAAAQVATQLRST